MSRFGYWAISNSASGGCGSHFSKWTTAVTVMMHICFTGDECRLTMKYYLLIKVQEWSKNVKKKSKLPVSRSISCDRGHAKVKNGSKP